MMHLLYTIDLLGTHICFWLIPALCVQCRAFRIGRSGSSGRDPFNTPTNAQWMWAFPYDFLCNSSKEEALGKPDIGAAIKKERGRASLNPSSPVFHLSAASLYLSFAFWNLPPHNRLLCSSSWTSVPETDVLLSDAICSEDSLEQLASGNSHRLRALHQGHVQCGARDGGTTPLEEGKGVPICNSLKTQFPKYR